MPASTNLSCKHSGVADVASRWQKQGTQEESTLDPAVVMPFVKCALCDAGGAGSKKCGRSLCCYDDNYCVSFGDATYEDYYCCEDP